MQEQPFAFMHAWFGASSLPNKVVVDLPLPRALAFRQGLVQWPGRGQDPSPTVPSYSYASRHAHLIDLPNAITMFHIHTFMAEQHNKVESVPSPANSVGIEKGMSALESE